MKIKYKRLKQLAIIFFSMSSLIIWNPNVKSAEQISIVSGAFKKTIPIEEFEYLAKTNRSKGLLQDLIRISNQDNKKLAYLLNQKVKLKLILTSRLINSRIGEVIIKRTAKIIYPSKYPDPKISVPAIRAGVISAIVNGKEEPSLLLFLKGYPNKVMTINLPELFKVIDKVESINDLVKFFSDSPLEGLKEPKP